MANDASDPLGMNQQIERRDFLQGAAFSTVALAAPPLSALTSWGHCEGVQDVSGYYPPTRLGMRGSHPGSFEAAHALRDGRQLPSEKATDGTHDLIIVGGGISGLSAAYFWRQQRPDARVLILENHDDFGGHAKRNEYSINGRMMLTNGGTLSIDSPRPYSREAAGLMLDLGIEPDALRKTVDHPEAYRRQGMRSATFFDRETFGADQLVTWPRRSGSDPEYEAAYVAALSRAPLSETAKRDIVRVELGNGDPLPGMDVIQKMDRLSRISYASFLRDVLKVDPTAMPVFQKLTHGEWGVGIEAISALDCWGIGLPGFRGLQLDRQRTDRMGNTAAGYSSTGGSYRFHFPDGNASIARLLVRKLVPAAAPGSTAEGIVTERFDYTQLDKPTKSVRIRLSSMVLNVKNSGDGVDVIYQRLGQTHRVHASACIMAGYNMMIPYLVPDLPDAQKAALHQLVKVPLVYASCSVRDASSFFKAGTDRIYYPGGYFSSFSLAPAQSIGGYHYSGNAAEPAIVQFTRTPVSAGLPTERDQHRAGRAELLGTPLETFERHMRDQLNRSLGAAGFDAARDIDAIIVNRWPHGYAYEYNPLYDPL